MVDQNEEVGLSVGVVRLSPHREEFSCFCVPPKTGTSHCCVASSLLFLSSRRYLRCTSLCRRSCFARTGEGGVSPVVRGMFPQDKWQSSRLCPVLFFDVAICFAAAASPSFSLRQRREKRARRSSQPLWKGARAAAQHRW